MHPLGLAGCTALLQAESRSRRRRACWASALGAAATPHQRPRTRQLTESGTGPGKAGHPARRHVCDTRRPPRGTNPALAAPRRQSACRRRRVQPGSCQGRARVRPGLATVPAGARPHTGLSRQWAYVLAGSDVCLALPRKNIFPPEPTATLNCQEEPGRATGSPSRITRPAPGSGHMQP